MTSAPSEITNATLIGPFAGGFRGVVCMVKETASCALAARLTETAQPTTVVTATAIQKSFFVLVMTVPLFNFDLLTEAEYVQKWNVSKDINPAI